MKKLILTATTYISLLTTAFAAPFPSFFPVKFLTVVGNLISLVPAIMILTFMGLFFWGGYTWMTAQDSEDKVTKAKSILLSAIVGIILVLLARPILELLQAFFGISETLI